MFYGGRYPALQDYAKKAKRLRLGPQALRFERESRGVPSWNTFIISGKHVGFVTKQRNFCEEAKKLRPAGRSPFLEKRERKEREIFIVPVCLSLS